MSATEWILVVVYSGAAAGLSLYGLVMVGYSIAFLLLRRRRAVMPPTPTNWPSVTVQLPLYNEKLVVERLIDRVAALDYPADRLHIQVLDDSTDETTQLARARVQWHASRGVNITLLHRSQPNGHKAGALAAGLHCSDSAFVAVFDADFLPPRDFLKRVLPHFITPRVGVVQARWGHLNPTQNALTRAQAIAIDGHHIIEQTVRSASGLCLNFNGSAGVWRRACIDGAGGWQADTLAEDLDLSYRAQIAGWRIVYLPEVIVPAEVPPRIADFKRQQARWAKGSVQALLKLAGPIGRSPLTLRQRLLGWLHLSGYFAHPLMLVMLLTALPLVLHHGPASMHLGWLGLGGFGAPLLFALSQLAGLQRHSLPQRLGRVLWLPALLLLGIGVALNNTVAVVEALIGYQPTRFLRTPKYRASGEGGLEAWEYRLPTHWTTWGELLLGVYGLATALLAWLDGSNMVMFGLLYGASFLWVAGVSLWEQRRPVLGRRWGRRPSVARSSD